MGIGRCGPWCRCVRRAPGFAQGLCNVVAGWVTRDGGHVRRDRRWLGTNGSPRPNDGFTAERHCFAPYERGLTFRRPTAAQHRAVDTSAAPEITLSRPTVRAYAFSAILALSFLPALARADDERAAAQHFRQGQRAFDGNDYARAAAEFEAANKAMPAAEALLGAGLSWEFAGDLLRAAAHLTAAIDARLTPADDAKARKHLADIDGKVGHLEMAGPAGVSAKLDGNQTPIPATIRVTPGDHTLET